MPKTSQRRVWVGGLKHSALGLEMGICVALGAAVGIWLDRRWDTQPVLTLVLLGLGIAAAFRALFRVAAQARREEEEGRDE